MVLVSAFGSLTKKDVSAQAKPESLLRCLLCWQWQQSLCKNNTFLTDILPSHQNVPQTFPRLALLPMLKDVPLGALSKIGHTL